ncbi:EF-hand calcium-binding domain-containing protein 10 [Trebouxia sp. C0009 RCD-2024]
MTAALLLQKPAEPCKFLVDYLTGLQKQGAQPALTREELRVMFGMFDVTEKGVVSVAQANQALKTLVGQGAELQTKDPTLRPGKTLGCEAFVTQMHGALREAAPSLAEAAT